MDVNDSTLKFIENEWFGFDREQYRSTNIEAELKKHQQRIVELMEMMQNQDRFKSFTLDKSKLDIIQENYPFVQSLSETQDHKGIVVRCTAMPMYVTVTDMPIWEGWHDATIYASNPVFNYDIVIKGESGGGRRLSYHFYNHTPELPRDFDNYLLNNAHPLLSIVPDNNSANRMAHPHTTATSRRFSSICYGTHHFARNIERGIKSPAEMYNVLENVLHWLQTMHILDWHGTHPTQQFVINYSLDRDTAVAICETFKEVRQIFFEAHRCYLGYETIPGHIYDKVSQLCRSLEQKMFVHDEDDAPVHVAVYSLLQALRSLRADLEYLIFEDLEVTSRDMRTLLRVHQAAYSSMLLALIQVDNSSSRDSHPIPPRVTHPVVRSLVINDLMPPNCNGLPDTRYANIDKVLAAPGIMRKYAEHTHGASEWVTTYFPEEVDSLEGFKPF